MRHCRIPFYFMITFSTPIPKIIFWLTSSENSAHRLQWGLTAQCARSNLKTSFLLNFSNIPNSSKVANEFACACRGFAACKVLNWSVCNSILLIDGRLVVCRLWFKFSPLNLFHRIQFSILWLSADCEGFWGFGGSRGWVSQACCHRNPRIHRVRCQLRIASCIQLF